MTDNSHAIANAASWLESIRDLVARLNGDDSDDSEAAREEIQDGPLSVQVRSGWYSPTTINDHGQEPAEFEILLSTGGPALRIVGDLGEHCEPEKARLEWQDWFQPWTEHETTVEDDETILAYAACFWFGE